MTPVFGMPGMILPSSSPPWFTSSDESAYDTTQRQLVQNKK